MGAKVIALVVYGMLTIVTCSGVWNHCPEGWVKVCAAFLMAGSAYGIYRIGKVVSKEYEHD